MNNGTRRFRVEGWSNVRFGRIEGNLIAFEVMHWGCACSSCLARLNTVLNRMKDSEVKWTMTRFQIPERLEMGLEGPSELLVLEPREMPKQVDVYLSDLLGLQISEVAPLATPDRALAPTAA